MKNSSSALLLTLLLMIKLSHLHKASHHELSTSQSCLSEVLEFGVTAFPSPSTLCALGYAEFLGVSNS